MDHASLGYAIVTNNHQNIAILTQALKLMEAILSCFQNCYERGNVALAVRCCCLEVIYATSAQIPSVKASHVAMFNFKGVGSTIL